MFDMTENESTVSAIIGGLKAGLKDVSGIHTFSQERDRGESRFKAAILGAFEYLCPCLANLDKTKDSYPKDMQQWLTLSAVLMDFSNLFSAAMVTLLEANAVSSASVMEIIMIGMANKMTSNLVLRGQRESFENLSDLDKSVIASHNQADSANS